VGNEARYRIGLEDEEGWLMRAEMKMRADKAERKEGEANGQDRQEDQPSFLGCPDAKKQRADLDKDLSS
jgi:hypothetical protein